MAQKNDDVVEVIDQTKKHSSRVDKVHSVVDSEFGVLTKAAAIYFEKLHDLAEATGSKKHLESPKEFLSNLDKAHRAAWKYVLDNSETHKKNEKLAERFLPDSAINDLHRWLDDSNA